MSNSVAIGLVLALAAFLALDYYVLHWDAPLFVAREFAGLLHRLAFWR